MAFDRERCNAMSTTPHPFFSALHLLLFFPPPPGQELPFRPELLGCVSISPPPRRNLSFAKEALGPESFFFMLFLLSHDRLRIGDWVRRFSTSPFPNGLFNTLAHGKSPFPPINTCNHASSQGFRIFKSPPSLEPVGGHFPFSKTSIYRRWPPFAITFPPRLEMFPSRRPSLTW